MEGVQECVVYESFGVGGVKVISRHPTFEQAYDAVAGRADCVMFENDFDNEDCADGILADGRVICVEPARRRGL